MTDYQTNYQKQIYTIFRFNALMLIILSGFIRFVCWPPFCHRLAKWLWLINFVMNDSLTYFQAVEKMETDWTSEEQQEAHQLVRPGETLRHTK